MLRILLFQNQDQCTMYITLTLYKLSQYTTNSKIASKQHYLPYDSRCTYTSQTISCLLVETNLHTHENTTIYLIPKETTLYVKSGDLMNQSQYRNGKNIFQARLCQSFTRRRAILQPKHLCSHWCYIF